MELLIKFMGAFNGAIRLKKLLLVGLLTAGLLAIPLGCGDDGGSDDDDDSADDDDDSGDDDDDDEWELVWSDEFEGSEVDDKYWTFDIGTGASSGWGNYELQYYTGRPENAEVADGKLHITARKESYETQDYTSARMKTRKKVDWLYGKFVARMKLPTGQGIWPAFWMINSRWTYIQPSIWPDCGEIDIMENKGNEPDTIHGSSHGPEFHGSRAMTKTYVLDEGYFYEDFHEFGLEWDPDYLAWSVDGEEYFKIMREDFPRDTWVFDEKFFMILSLSVGGQFGGDPDETTEFPQVWEIDWIRVYNRK